MGGANQHFLMQSILRGFAANGDTRVYLFERNQEPSLKSTTEVAAEQHFYSDESTDGLETLDDKISRYERQKIAQILGALRSAPSGAAIGQADAAELVDHLTIRSGHLRGSFSDAAGSMAERAIDVFSDGATVSGLLKVAGNTEGAFISQIIDLILKERPGLAALPLPRRVLEQIVRTALDENRESVVDNLKSSMAALRNGLAWLGAAARAGHNRGLEKTLGQTRRAERLMDFHWSMERIGHGHLILPDCVALALVSDSPDLQPLNLIDIDDARLILVPFAPRRLLVGRKTQEALPEISEINHASAVCSHSFFVSMVSTDELQKLSGHIGERNSGIINSLVGEAIDEARLKIQLPESAPEGPPANVISNSHQASRTPYQYVVAFRDCADQTKASEVAEVIAGIVNSVSQVEQLDRLDGMTFAFDYEAALRELDRGFESHTTLVTSADSSKTGVAMVPSVIRDGVVKKHIVMRGDLAWALASDDELHVSQATYVLVYELMHVVFLQLLDESLPGTVLRPLRSRYEAILNAHVGNAAEAYFSSRKSALVYPGRSEDLLELVVSALERMQESVPSRRRAYLQNGDLDTLTEHVLSEGGFLITAMAEFLGHHDGLEDAGGLAESTLSLALRQCGLERWAQHLHEKLLGIWNRSGKWSSYDEFLVLNRSLERVLWQFKIITWEIEGDLPMYVLVLSD